MFRILSRITVAFLFLAVISGLLIGQMTRRLVLTGATVIDGTGKPGFAADVAVLDGKIVEVGKIESRSGDERIDISGLTLAPGFIDVHNHSAQGILEEPQAASQVSQGITTLVVGPDGSSPFPPGPYLSKVAARGSAVNLATMVGHGTLRSLVLGDDFKRKADAAEIQAMAALLQVGLEQGAFGLSSGLEYDPGFYSSTDELITLARIAARYGGIYMSHIRDEEEGILEAVSEAVEIGRKARLPIQISHLKLGNTRVWGQSRRVLDLLEKANAEGIDVQADCYPYNAWASGLSILVPSRRFEDRAEILDGFEKVGGAGKVLITNYSPDPSFEFKTMDVLALEHNVDVVDLFMEMIQKGGAGVVCESMSDTDVEAFYSNPLVMVASDGGIDSRHPRKAGTFSRVLSRFVREKNLLTLEQAIHKMSAQPAGRLGLKGRGTIATGMAADLVVFDAATVTDRSTFSQPDLLSEGIELVFVNGAKVWERNQPTGQLPGRILRREQP